MPKYIITKAPAPLDWAKVAQPLLGTPRAIAVTSSAPNPDSAKAFIDYWLSDEAMSILAEDVGEYVLAPAFFPPIEGMDKAEIIAIRELSDEEIQQWGMNLNRYLRLNNPNGFQSSIKRIIMEIQIKELSKYYYTDGKIIKALDNINIKIPGKRICTLLGPSGCGKTTLLRCIVGLEKPDSGEIK